jgi:hypothetical protein
MRVMQAALRALTAEVRHALDYTGQGRLLQPHDAPNAGDVLLQYAELQARTDLAFSALLQDPVACGACQASRGSGQR